VRKAILVYVVSLLLGVVGVLYGGPLTSGGLFLLLPRQVTKVAHDLPESYEPTHRGHVDLSLGMYVRENEDLIVRGTPPLVLRRVYISGYRISRQFGIGAMHDGEWYVIGDGASFQWAALVRPGLPQIRFERTSSGTSVMNAMFEHRASTGEWQGARLGWTGVSWALRKQDGSLMVFRACNARTPERSCSIVRSRDENGHVVQYRRTAEGRLLRIESEDKR
jgi:YD repeat-containing protein